MIREPVEQDRPGLLSLAADIFPDEDLRPLVAALWREPGVLSLAAFRDAGPVGLVLFTPCGLEGKSALLGPLGVVTADQGQGLGSRLVQTGVERLREIGTRQIFVLGDPAYYRRFGFRPEKAVTPPCPIPKDWAPAWQSLTLSDPIAPGELQVPAPRLTPAYWAP
ncbi:MAG: N-acetyltransferase [Pseudomonadota bacterium]